MKPWALLGALLLCAHAWAIDRSAAEIRAFRKTHPCPATGLTRGACRGYQVDHAIPLCAGGADSRNNMHWLAVDDHRFKTLVDVRECRKLARMAATPALETLRGR